MSQAGYVTYILEGRPATDRAVSYLDELSQALDGARQRMRFATEAMPGAHENRRAPELARKLADQAMAHAEMLAEKGNWLVAAQMRLIAIALVHDAEWQSSGRAQEAAA